MEKILDFQTREIPGEHARGNFRLLLSENETGINGLNAPIQLCGHGNTAGALFCGYQEKVEIKEEGRYRIADVQAVSGTILLDQKKCNRVFQKKAQTYMGIANTVTADTEHSACILPGSDMQTGGTLIQYQETDWNFLKRMASQLGLPLVPDISYYYPRFYLGLPEGEKKELGEILSCDMCFDGRYYAVSGRCTVDRKDFICYDVVTGTRLSLGDRVTYEGRELTVSRKKTELVRGEVLFTYRLAGESYTRVAPEENPDYTGMSFVGEVTAACGERVELAFDMDRASAGGNSYGFAPATGNLMYCMTLEEKLAYIFDPGQMAVDFVTGVVIGEAVDGIANKLPDAWFKKGFGKKSEIWDSQVRGGLEVNTDMTKYCFQHFENAYNIGWKNNHKSSKQEDYGKEFIEKLKVFCQYPVNKDLNGKFRYLDAKEGGKCVTGFGEIRIIDIKNNIRYAAPNIIVLDILDGLYFPPKEFIDAVMDCPEYASEEYKDFIRAYTEHNFWGENKQVIENIETACLLIQQDHNYFKEFVLENKAINIVTKKGSLLNYAIQLKDNEIAEWLIEEKIDINSFDGLELLTALKMNNTRIALQLLRHGIITDGDEMKSNPLLFAIKIGSRELVEELMTKHRHLVAVYTNEYVKNYTILDIAKRYKNDQIIQTVKKYL